VNGKLLGVLAIVFALVLLFAGETQPLLWVNEFGSPGTTSGWQWAKVSVTDEGFVAALIRLGDSSPYSGFYLFDKNGNTIWERQTELAQGSDLSGSFAVFASETELILVDISECEILWENTLNLGEGSYVEVAKNGQVFVTDANWYLNAFDKDGNLLWRTYVGEYAKISLSDSGRYLAVNSYSGTFLFDNDGNLLDTFPVASGWLVDVNDNGHIVVCDTDGITVRFFGDSEWSLTLDMYSIYSMALNNNDLIVTGGYVESYYGTWYGHYAVALISNGQVLWTKPYSTKFSELTVDDTEIWGVDIQEHYFAVSGLRSFSYPGVSESHRFFEIFSIDGTSIYLYDTPIYQEMFSAAISPGETFAAFAGHGSGVVGLVELSPPAPPTKYPLAVKVVSTAGHPVRNVQIEVEPI